MEKLRGIVYVSEALVDFDANSLEDLATKAAKSNKALGVTGYLYYENKLFLQYIEGEQKTVQQLMDRIAKDPRHRVINHLTADDIPARYFPSWHMRHLTKPTLVKVHMEEIILEYIEMLTKIGLQKIEGSKRNVWNMINKLSKLRPHLIESY